jgi:hypothetical protein
MLTAPFLVLSLQLDLDTQINCGRLFLYDFEKGHLGHWIATSGLGQYQKPGDWEHKGGGVLPPPHCCNPKFANYWVETEPQDGSDIKGIEGDMFIITPEYVSLGNGVKRGLFRIHRDANVPGTLGCIGLPGGEFNDFKSAFQSLTEGHEKVKLWVQYDYGNYPM